VSALLYHAMAWWCRGLKRCKFPFIAAAVGSLFINDVRQHSDSLFVHDNFRLERTTSLIKTSLQTIPSPNPIRSFNACCKDKDLHHFDFIADAAEKALPAVVSIEVKQRQNYVFEVQGSGSGFIVDKRGYIITNEHVIAGSTSVTVVLGNGRKIPGTVVAVDSLTDLALVKVTTDVDLPVVRMGDDSKLRPGQWVVAIGNSLHFPNTVTAGIVSNTSRTITDNDMLRYQAPKVGHSKYVQTDAAINPGSSGGPLVNLAGEVIAVNTMGVLSNASGIAFSIPVSEVKRFLQEFSHGDKRSSQVSKVTYSLGLRIITLTPGMASFLQQQGQLDPSLSSGVFVFDTCKNSPAYKANLIKGDVIIAIGNDEVHTKDDLSKAVQRSGGKPVRVTFFRPGRGFLFTDITPEKA